MNMTQHLHQKKFCFYSYVKNILYIDESTGIGELVMDPQNPNKLIANMWQFRRWPWFFKSGGPSSGLYITFDVGNKWKKLSDKDGLPK